MRVRGTRAGTGGHSSTHAGHLLCLPGSVWPCQHWLMGPMPMGFLALQNGVGRCCAGGQEAHMALNVTCYTSAFISILSAVFVR